MIDDTELGLFDRSYAAIMSNVIETKTAPHFTALARQLDIPIERAREVTHELVGMTPGWTHPGTDYLASFPPFNLQPTQYEVTINGEPGWYAQCGFEALAIRWLVPGKEVRVEAPCLCCGDPVVVTMQDDELSVDPAEAVGYTSAQVGGSAESRPFR